MEKHVVHLVFERNTPNTVRYSEVHEPGRAPVIKTLYVQKWALGKKTPLELTVTIEHIPAKPKEE